MQPAWSSTAKKCRCHQVKEAERSWGCPHTGSYNCCRPTLNTPLTPLTVVQLPTQRAEPQNLSPIPFKQKHQHHQRPTCMKDSPAPAVLGSEPQRGTVFRCSVSWTAEVQAKRLPGDLPRVNYCTLSNTATATHFFKSEAFFSVTNRHCIYLLLTHFCCNTKKRCEWRQDKGKWPETAA